MKKTMGPGADCFVSVYTTRAYNPDGWFLFFHYAGLDAACMGAQQPVWMLVDKKSVLHITGRMVFGKIKGRKVMPVIFYFRAFGNRKTESSKNMHNLVSDQAYRMSCSKRKWIAG